MLKKIKQIEIDPEDIFKNDALDRKVAIENLTEIIKNAEEGFVMSVNASWGAGKTTFIHLWEAYLESSGFKSIYFNAWEHDYSKEPLLSIMGALEPSGSSGAKKSFDTVKKAGIELIKVMVPVAVRLGTMGILSADDLKKVIPNGADSGIAAIAGRLAEERLKAISGEKAIHESFRDALTEFAKEETQKCEDGKKKIVFFIDELDRCRPTYAVELLEVIKHFFSVENIVFVLAVDMEQLGHSIGTMYGSGMDKEGYLRRFIDIRFNLETKSKEKYIKQLFEMYDLQNYFETRRKSTNIQHEQESTLTSLVFFADAFELSLRDIERVFMNMITALMLTMDNKRLIPDILIMMIALKIHNESMFKEIVKSCDNREELIEYIKKRARSIGVQDDKEIRFYEALINVSTRNHHTLREWKKELNNKINKLAEDNDEMDRLKGILDTANDFSLSQYSVIDTMPYIIEKIEFLEQVQWSREA